MTRALLSRPLLRLQISLHHQRLHQHLRFPVQQLFVRNSTTSRLTNNTTKSNGAAKFDKQPHAAINNNGSFARSAGAHDKTMYMGRPIIVDGVVPGAHVIEVAKKHDIGFPTQLKRLGIRLGTNSCNIQVQYSNRHLFERQDMKWLDTLEHPFAGSVLERYAEWSDGSRPLWWNVNAYGNVAPFVCTTAQRRLTRGVRLALEENGYDKFGRKLVAYGQKPRLDDPLNLFGTLRIQCARPKELCQLTSPDIMVIGRAIIKEATAQLLGDYRSQAQVGTGSQNRFPRSKQEPSNKDARPQRRPRKSS